MHRDKGDLRVSWAHTEELHAPALNAAWVSSRPFGIGLIAIGFSDFAIITGVTVNQDANHAKVLCTLDLEASENAAIFCNGNLAL